MTGRETFQRWLKGAEIADLGDGAEAELRGQVAELIELVMSGKQQVMAALEAGVYEQGDGEERHAWQRFYWSGHVHARALATNIVGHAFNRVGMWLSAGWEDDDG